LAGALAWCAAVGLAAFATGAPAGRLLVAALAAGLVAVWMARWLQQRLGGFTGDTLGASQQVAELAIYLAWLALW
jgi:adenosylcobinamide-GDP ribazoletransferase